MNEDNSQNIFLYRIDPTDRLICINENWLAFAQANDAPYLEADEILNRSLWDFVTNLETRHLYEMILAKVRRGEVIRLHYRCDSPECRRFMELIVSRLRDGYVQFDSRILRQEQRDPVDLFAVNMPRAADFLTVCSWCKKVQIAENRWVEVEEAVDRLHLFERTHLPQLTHGMCGICFKDINETVAECA